MRSTAPSVGVAALAALALTACGSAGTPSTPATSSTSGGRAEPEVTELEVGALPLADYAALYWAQDHGFFEQEGLTVTLQPVQGGPIAAQDVAAGELDLSYSNTISTSVATQGGLPIQTVVLTSALGAGGLALYVRPDSPVQSLQDLDGATIGINATTNIGDVALRNLLDEQGLQDVEPTFVEVPFPEMLTGVQSGAIDVGYAPEPFSSAALDAGMRQVADLADPQGPNARLTVANFIASDRFIAENPGTVDAFARAVYAAGQDIEASEEEFRVWLPAVADVPAEVAAAMALPDYLPATDVAEIQRVVDVLVGQGLLDEGYDPAEHTYLPEGAAAGAA